MLEIIKELIGWFVAVGFVWWQSLILICLVGFIILVYTRRINLSGIFSKNKLTCVDCIQIIETKKKLYLTNYNRVRDSVLKSQMEYTEQKIIDLLFVFLDDFSKTFEKSINKDEIFTFLTYLLKRFENDEALTIKIQDAINKLGHDSEIVQKKLYWLMILDGLERGALLEVKRSYIENGFHNKTDDEFKAYLHNRYTSIINIMKSQIAYNYPLSGMTVTQDEIMSRIVELSDKINLFINDVYSNAKRIKIDSEYEMSRLTTEFEKDLSTFQGVK